MTAVLVPTPVSAAAPDRTLRTRLDGREYLLRLVWNGRDSRWYLHVSASDGTLLAASLKVVCGWPLLQYKGWSEELPGGEIWAVSLTGDQSPPGIDDLGEGKRVELTYYPEGT